MLAALATGVLRFADKVHTLFGTTNDVAEFTAVVAGRSIGYDIICDDRAPSRPATLVVGLHGFGADEQQLRTLVPLEAVGSPILYVALRGSWTVVGAGFAWFPVEEGTDGGFDVEAAELDDAVDELHSFIETARRWPRVNPDRTWLIGYSQGATLALHAMAQHPDQIAGCAVGAGTMLAPRQPDSDLTGVEVMIASSTIDPFVTPDQTDDLKQQLTRAGAHVEIVIDAAPHVITTTQAAAIAGWLNEHLPPTPRTRKSNP